MALKKISNIEFYLKKIKNLNKSESHASIQTILLEIKQAVLKKKDAAVIQYCKKFDGVNTTNFSLKVSSKEIKSAYNKVPPGFIKAIKKAKQK